MAEAGGEGEDEVCLVMLWWITVPGHWRFLHLQRAIEKIFFLILRNMVKLKIVRLMILHFMQ
uniref:RNA binding motif protein 26 n=2 Tax=Cercopithecidae TaxID=9527 RepID=A0A2K6A6G6_MANLE